MGTKQYAFNSTARLSANFVVSEFRCKCGKAHTTLVSSELVNGLQQLIGKLGATKAIITSGYRCSAHDRTVGGNGAGQHTLGTAADVIFYDATGKAIDTKFIACKAQDLGFNGIGRISATAIHLDVRTSNRWYGDETVPGGTANSVTTDFYSYYGITRDSKANADIKELQRILNGKGAQLTVDGIVGPNTLKAAKKYIIEKGDKGELTKWLQKRLNSEGFNCGTPDGVAGEKTMAAINAWQKAKKLGIGYLGGSDWDILLK